jgi:transcriptional regulator with XRE-family HTH domain
MVLAYGVTAARRSLASRRAALGYTQERLAEAIGADRATIGRWENGASLPSPRFRRPLAEHLALSVLELAELLATVQEAGE